MLRVLKPGGMGLILEFSKPKKFPIKQVFGLYFKHIMPTVGKWVSKDPSAYSYLEESVQAFPEGPDFENELRAAGYTDVRSKSLTFGIATIYTGRKPETYHDSTGPAEHIDWRQRVGATKQEHYATCGGCRRHGRRHNNDSPPIGM